MHSIQGALKQFPDHKHSPDPLLDFLVCHLLQYVQLIQLSSVIKLIMISQIYEHCEVLGLIDWIVFYAVSDIFQQHNGCTVLESRPEALICTCRNTQFQIHYSRQFFPSTCNHLYFAISSSARITKLIPYCRSWLHPRYIIL